MSVYANPILASLSLILHIWAAKHVSLAPERKAEERRGKQRRGEERRGVERGPFSGFTCWLTDFPPTLLRCTSQRLAGLGGLETLSQQRQSQTARTRSSSPPGRETALAAV